MSAMSNQIYSNNVNRAATETSEDLVSGRGPACKFVDLCRQSDTVSPKQNNKNSTTARKSKNRKWSKEENMLIIEYYFRSNPSRLRYNQKMLELWNRKGLFFITELRLVDQTNNIQQTGWLTEIELEEIERKIELDNCNKKDTDPDNVTPQEKNTTTMSEEEPSVEQVDEPLMKTRVFDILSRYYLMKRKKSFLRG